jgi:hypothetical protein
MAILTSVSSLLSLPDELLEAVLMDALPVKDQYWEYRFYATFYVWLRRRDSQIFADLSPNPPNLAPHDIPHSHSENSQEPLRIFGVDANVWSLLSKA